MSAARGAHAAHTATVRWVRGDAPFVDRRYGRAHTWTFDGGAVVPASSSPAVVRTPFSDASAVDPEEAYVAAIASCHLLWFLDFAARRGFVVDRYVDAAEATMAELRPGIEHVERIVLRPAVAFVGARRPDDADVDALHRDAHAHCFLANSVRTEIVTAGTWSYRARAG